MKNLANDGAEFVQKDMEDLQKALDSIPKNDPLSALLELSTSINKEKLREVIEKLEGIQEAIKASMSDDENGEKASKAKYEKLMDDLDNDRRIKNKKLGTAKNNKGIKEAE